MLFSDPRILTIFAFLVVGMLGANFLLRCFQKRDQKKAETARKAERDQEKAERNAARAARASTRDGASGRPVQRQAASIQGQALRQSLIHQGIIRPAVEDEDQHAGQRFDPDLQPAAALQNGSPAI